MTRVAVAFYKGRTRVFNKLTSRWTNGPYSHCEFLPTPDLADEDGAVLSFSSSFMDGGVRGKWINYNPDHWDLVYLELPERDVLDAITWFEVHDGDKYDVLGLAGFLLRPISGEQHKWFCSEAVAEVLKFEDSWRFCPNTLFCALSRYSVN